MASSQDFDNDITLIRDLAAVLEETGLTDIEIERDGVKIRVGRNTASPAPPAALATITAPIPGSVPAATGAAASTAAASSPDLASSDHPGAIKSPMVGTAYMAPSPGAADFVTIGDTVREGQTLLIIEAMKTMNEIKAPRGGKVIDIIARDAEPVEFGEALMIVG